MGWKQLINFFTSIFFHCVFAFVLSFAILTFLIFFILNYSARFFKIFARVFIVRGAKLPSFRTCFYARSLGNLAKVFAFLSSAPVYASPFLLIKIMIFYRTRHGKLVHVATNRIDINLSCKKRNSFVDLFYGNPRLGNDNYEERYHTHILNNAMQYHFPYLCHRIKTNFPYTLSNPCF